MSTRQKKLIRKFKDETLSLYETNSNKKDFKIYVVSTAPTRILLNEPHIINTNFTNMLSEGIQYALTGINKFESLSSISSKQVNVYHILRGGLNFKIVDTLKKSFGYNWHSSSYITSQRVLINKTFKIEEDTYRKFVIPDKSTVYTADIVATGSSLDNGFNYLFKYLLENKLSIENLIFITIGCDKTEKILNKWHNIFKKKFKKYNQTITIYLEGIFGLADSKTDITLKEKDTDLLKNHKYNSLLTPEFEKNVFNNMEYALERCVIYDGGKKGFEPAYHFLELINYWSDLKQYSIEQNINLWDEYNRRFSLEHYFKDIKKHKKANWKYLKEKKTEFWRGISDNEFKELFKKFELLWDANKIKNSIKPDSLTEICDKRIRLLKGIFA